MVGAVDHHHVPPSGERPGKPQGQIVGFAPGIDEIADTERRRELRRQAPGIADEILMEVPGVRIQDGQPASAPLRRRADGRGRRAEHCSPCNPDRPGPSHRKMLAEAADDLERIPVGNAQGPSDQGLPLFYVSPFAGSRPACPWSKAPRTSSGSGQKPSETSFRPGSTSRGNPPFVPACRG